jgi:hypothetical protein
MKSHRMFLILLILNLALLAFQFARAQTAESGANSAVLRCRALELLDDHGRVRAELKVLPAQPNLKMPDGTVGYPETVLLRLINSTGSPHVKLSASEDGAGMVLGGDGSHVQILSRGANPSVEIVDRAGRQKVIKP